MNKDKSETRNNTHLAVVSRRSSVSGRPRNTLLPAMIKPMREAAIRDTSIVKSFTLVTAFLGRSYQTIVENPGQGFGAIKYLEIARSRGKRLILSFSS